MKESTRAKLGFVLIIMSAILWVATGAQLPSFGLDGFGGGDDLPATTESDHKAALADAGSFNVTLTESRDGTAVRTTYLVNLSDGVKHKRMAVGSTVQEWYTDGNATYKLERSDGSGTTVSSNASAVNTSHAMGVQMILDNGVTYSEEGNEMYEGHNVTRYEGTGVTDVSVFSPVFRAHVPDVAKVKSFSATLLIDQQGVVRYHEWSVKLDISGRTVEMAGQFRISGVGETTVEEPHWASEA